MSRLAWLVALLAVCIAGPALAASAALSTNVARLPDPPGAATALVVLDGAPVAIGGHAAFAYEGRGWHALARPALPRAGAAPAGDGTRALLLPARGPPLLLDRRGATLRATPLPPLPFAADHAALAGDRIVVAGRDGRLAERDGGGWRALSGWPGGGRAVALALQNGALFATLADGRQWRWTAHDGWHAGARAPGAPLAVRPVGQAYLLYLLAGPSGARLWSYSAITDAWAALGPPLGAVPVAAAPYRDGLALLDRDGHLTTLALAVPRRALALLDQAIIGLYLVGMLGVGLYFYRRAKGGSSSEFFLGSRAIPFWAAGISMFAGSISSISYLAVPAKAFETDWEYIMSKVTTVFGLIFVAIWVVPLFRRLNLVSVFNYLEARFHPAVRLLASALWIAMQVGGRMGIVLFLPALAIGTITDTSIVACIVVVGLFTLVYTALGGMRAVVWTDVFQVVVLTGGALFAIGVVAWRLGFPAIWATAQAFDKTRMVNWSLDPAQPTVWAFTLLALCDVVLTFPKDQVLMQRVLATPSVREASRSVWLFAAVLLPSAFMFYMIGTALFAYYHANPARLNPLLPIDAVFPAFIGSELPPGITGLIIAGLIAAAMGTLSGIINSVATLLSVDFYEKFRRTKPSQRQSVRFAEAMSVVVGLVGIGIAIILSRLDIHSLLDLTIELFGLFGGACAGAYTLGMFTRRANWQGVVIGIVLSSFLTLAVWLGGLVHPYLYLAIAILSSIVIGYAASLPFAPPPPAALDGLTVYGARKEAGPSTSPS